MLKLDINNPEHEAYLRQIGRDVGFKHCSGAPSIEYYKGKTILVERLSSTRYEYKIIEPTEDGNLVEMGIFNLVEKQGAAK